MASDADLPSFDRRAWLKVGALILALLAVPIAAWIVLGGTPDASVVASASPRRARPAALPTTDPEEVGATRSISGKVTDDGGKGLGGVTVTFMPTGQSIPRHTIRTDDDGSFFLDGAPTDGGALSAKLDGWVGTPVMVGPDVKDVANLALRIHQAAGVKGQVVDSDGRPVDHAMVTCDEGKGQASTAADGTYTLAIDDAGCTATATHPDFGASEPARVRAGTRNILELPSPGGIAGSVVDEQGRPVPSFMVSVESFVPTDKDMDRMGGLSQPVNDGSGNFELKGLARGKYVLAVVASGRPPARSEPIQVTAGRVTRNVRIAFARGISLSGVVTDRATHQPIKGAHVSLDAMTSGPNGISSVLTDDAGNYTLDGVPAAAFSVRFSAPSYSDRIVTLDGRGKSELRSDVDLAAGSAGGMEMSGIGATLMQGTGFVSVMQALPDGPAEAAGLTAGDRILRIDGEDASSFTVSDCIQRLRGPEGSVVLLTIAREGARRDLRITRARIVR